MKKKSEKILAMVTALCCMASATACARKVQNASENNNEGFVVVGDKADVNESTEQESSLTLVPRTTAASDSANTSVSNATAATNTAEFVTRSKEEIEKINSKKTTSTVKATESSTSGTSKTTTSTTQTSTTATTEKSPSAPTIQLSYTSAEIIVGQTKTYAMVTGTYDEEWTTSDANVATVDQYGNITAVGEGSCKIRVTDKNTKEFGEISVTTKKMQGIQQIDGITYIDGVLIANKTYALPRSYNPGGLTSETYNAFQSLVQAAANDGYSLWNASGFRSYESQEQIYNNYVYTHGQATADTFSARPGHSEHQTGMAIDVNNPSDSFNGTPEAIWLKEHCVDYGFIIRYPEGKQDITGYKYESWHIRYVGVEMAKKLRDAGIAKGDANITLEEYFGITSNYN
ncbi:MAG: D-alanyl-D-alanine carboxypeptidase family protein [Ruminococcus sp.]|nr:D-alanyl-D-alanine carboxypeptidase family protein [Ruminococcus sp.]